MAAFRPFPIKDNGKLPFNGFWVTQVLSRVESLSGTCPKTS